MFQDFSKLGILKQPIYFNTVRDPYDRQIIIRQGDILKLNLDKYFRFKSRYYWLRHRTDKHRKRWFENYHLIEPEADPRGGDYWWAEATPIFLHVHYHLIKLREWNNKTFEECVLDIKDQECHITDGSIRDLAIVTKRNIGIDPEKVILKVNFQPYFCGQDLECTRHNSRWALRQAIENVQGCNSIDI